MTSERDVLLARLDELIGAGRQVEQMGVGRGGVNSRAFNGWRVRAISLLERTVGASDVYYQSFVERCKDSWRSDAAAGAAIVESFRDDVAAGYLTRYGNLVAASVFEDFLAMADHLLTEGFKDPAASLIGAVLEDGLRNIARNGGIEIKSSDGLDALNRKCTTAGLYGALQEAQVNSVRLVRNSADHGKFEEYSEADVRSGLEITRNLLAAHLG